MSKPKTAIGIMVAVGVVAGIMAWWRYPSAGDEAQGAVRSALTGSPSAVRRLTPEHQQLIDKIDDPMHRAFCAHAFSLGDRTPNLDDLEPFLEELRLSSVPKFEVEGTEAEASYEVFRVERSLSYIADAWIKAGPLEAIRDAALRDAVRFADHPDMFVRTSSAVLLLAIQANPGTRPFPDEAEACLDRVLQHPYIGSQAKRRHESWSAAARKRGG